MDLAQANNVPGEIVLGDATYPIRKLKVKEWAQLQAFVKREYPSHMERAARAVRRARAAGDPLDATTRDEMFDHAQRADLSWPPPVGSQRWLNTVEDIDGGLQTLLFEVLSKADPGFTREAADLLSPRLDVTQWLDLIHFATDGVHYVPKAPPPGDAGGPTTTSSPSPTSGNTPTGA
jgi:hypothetical protein